MRLAGYGFVVAVPEIYHRVEPAGTVLGFDDAGKVRGQADAEATPVPSSTRTSTRALDWLAERCPSVGAAGHCTGGHLAFRAAFDARVRGTACWYPTGLHDGKLGKEPTDCAGARGRDRRRAAADLRHARPAHAVAGRARRPRRARRRRHALHAGIEYDAEHAFGRDIGPRFDPEATDLAFAETVAFFRRVL